MHIKNNFFFQLKLCRLLIKWATSLWALDTVLSLAWDLFVQYAVVFFNIISLESSGGWQSWNTRGDTSDRWKLRTSALSSISALLQQEWGLPCLSLPLHFAHEARHLEGNIALNTRITGQGRRKQRYIFNIAKQSTTNIWWPWCWEMIDGFQDSPAPQKALPALSLAVEEQAQ